MDADQLLDLILRGESERVVEALAPLSDAERRKLSRPVAQLCRKMELGHEIEPPADATVWRKQRQRVLGPPPPVLEAACLARYGVCPRSQLRSNRLWFFWNEAAEARLLRILRDRRPDFLSDWIGDVYDQASDEDPAQLRWPVVRALIREGLVDRPAHPDYVTSMAAHFVPRWGQVPKHLSQRLLDDPGLLDDEVWWLFEVDIGRDAWFRKPVPETRGGEPQTVEAWGGALLRLSRDGHLDRDRLLSKAFEALSRSALNSSSLTGIRRFAEYLEPTLDDLASRQSELFRMLGCGESPVVGWAVKCLGQLQRRGRLDAEGFVRALPTVFEISAKSHPLRALKLLEKVLGAGGSEVDLPDDELRVAVAEAAGRALLHPSRDVQDRAVAILERLATQHQETDQETSPLATVVARHAEAALPTLAPAQADQLARVVGAEAPTSSGDETLDADEIEQLRRRFEGLRDDVRRVHGLEGSWDEMWPHLPPAWSPPAGTPPRLAHVERIEPIADWEELVDAASHAAEVVESADEIERILAGLPRFGTQRPDGFERRTEALAASLGQPSGEFQPRGLRGAWSSVASDLEDLLRIWLRGQRFRASYIRRSIGPFPFFSRRVREIAVRLRAQRTDPLLAAPTHSGGWIEPEELVRRLEALGDRPHDPCDLVQALLRLAPDGREQALDRAGRLGDRLHGRLGPLTRFALGGDDRPTSADRKLRLAWLAAARSRDPSGSARPFLEGLGRRGLRGLGAGPDGMEPAEIRWAATTVRQRGAWVSSGSYPHLDISTSGKEQPLTEPHEVAWTPLHVRAGRAIRRWIGRALAETDLPTAALYRIADYTWEPADLQTEWQIDWLRTLWPARADGVLAAGARWTIRRLDMAASGTSPNHAYLTPLFDVDRPWTDLAYLATVTALMSRDADARPAALDALIEGIEDGRVHPEPLADVVVRFFAQGWAKTNRLAETLDEVSRVGPLHQLVVARVLGALVSTWTERPHGAHLVLQLLLDCLEALGDVPTASTSEVLKGFQGQSKTAKLARRLRKLEPTADRAKRSAVAQAFRARLDRCELAASLD